MFDALLIDKDGDVWGKYIGLDMWRCLTSQQDYARPLGYIENSRGPVRHFDEV